MGFREGAFATVWEVTDRGDNFTKIRVSTSRKDKKNDEYVTDFNGFVSLIGEAHKKADLIDRGLENGDRYRIKLGACDVTNRYDKAAGREFVNYTLFDFESADGSSSDGGSGKSKNSGKKTNNGAKKAKAAPPPLEDDSDDENESDSGDDLPF